MYRIDGKLVLLLLRGCDSLSEQKLIDSVEAQEIRPAGVEEIRSALGASPGSLGAVAVKDLYIIADEALTGRTDLVTGAKSVIDDHNDLGIGHCRYVGRCCGMPGQLLIGDRG